MKATELLGLPRRLARHFFVDPLTVKELSGIARRWQVYAGRCVYIGLIGFIIWLFWMELSNRGGWMSPSAYADLGRNLFRSFFGLQLVIVTLGALTSASDMVTRELRAGTLGLLALTPLTPWRIVAGKWKAALVQTSTVILCGAPVFAVCVYLGGVGLRELAYSLTLSVISAAFGAAVALLCSSIFRASYVATIVALISLLVYCVLPLLPMFAMRGRSGEEWMTVLCWTHPLYAAIGAAMPGSGGMGGLGTPWGSGWYSATGITAAMVYVLLRASTERVSLLIRGPGGSAAAEAPSSDPLSGSPVVKNPRIAMLARFLRGRGGVWQSNAILWKELSTRRVGGGKAARLGLALLVFLLLTAMISEEWWRIMVLWFSFMILLLVALANGVSLFVTEREERKWDILLSTPLGARELVTAKLLAGLAGMASPALLLFAFWSLVGGAFNLTTRGVVMSMVPLLLATLLTYMVGAFASLNARSQRTAFSSSFGVLLGLFVVLPILILTLEGFQVIPRGEDYGETFFSLTNPGRYLAYMSEGLTRNYYWDGWQSHRAAEERKLWEFFVVYSGIYAAAIGGLVVWLTYRFDRATGRS